MIKVITNNALACDSEDYLYPWGTKENNTSAVFIKDVEKYFNDKPIKFLDLGCAGGQLVIDFKKNGHLAVGLEGCDWCLNNGNENWANHFNDQLFLCDISKQFSIVDDTDNEKILFDCITAWDVVEHIAPENLDCFFNNILTHLSPSGVFIATIAYHEDIVEKHKLHQSVFSPYTWKSYILPQYFSIINTPEINHFPRGMQGSVFPVIMKSSIPKTNYTYTDIKYSILIPYNDRLNLLSATLDSFIKHNYDKRTDLEIIIVEDYKNQVNTTGHKQLKDILHHYSHLFYIKHLERPEEYINDPSPHFNMAAKSAAGEYLVITNPECLHITNILEQLDNMIKVFPRHYIICACQSDTGWYQHSVHRNTKLHWCSIIHRDHYALVNGFDEAFSKGVAFQDNDFLTQIQTHNIPIITSDNLIVYHQAHAEEPYVKTRLQKWHKNHNLYHTKWDHNKLNDMCHNKIPDEPLVSTVEHEFILDIDQRWINECDFHSQVYLYTTPDNSISKKLLINTLDMMNYLPETFIWKALANITASDVQFLSMMQSNNCQSYTDEAIGVYREINWTLPPFNFPSPLKTLPPNDYIWDIKHIRDIVKSKTLNIPKILHTIWIGDQPLPDTCKEYINTWKKYHPNWKHMHWGDKEIADFDMTNRDIFNKATKYAEKADIARYEILYQYGGLYVDTDFECLANIEFIIQDIPQFSAYSWNNIMAIGLLGSTRHNCYYKHIIDNIPHFYNNHNTIQYDPSYHYIQNEATEIMFKTGPYFFTQVLKDKPSFIVFFKDYFYPYFCNEEYLGAEHYPNAYAIHHWHFTWK